MKLTRTPSAGEAYAVVLAAGAGARFGGDKLLASLHGRPLVAHAAAAVVEAIAAGTLAGGVAVAPPGMTALARHLEAAGLRLIENTDPSLGIASSLRTGLVCLEQASLRPPAGAAVIVLADQPLLRADVIARLVAAWRTSGRNVRPRYALAPEVPGHPLLVDRAHWPLSSGLAGDEGLGRLLAARPGLLDLIDVPGANPDVDTLADLTQLEQRG
ncbi:MAG: NTP transferase domain-containing protein [Chloroflexota bacterium]|nr:NTP transferase domain-containing protein [Chloroflexota bacterium]